VSGDESFDHLVISGLAAPTKGEIVMSATIQTQPAIGAEMHDGTIYAGVSPDTGKAMYATPKDAPLTCTFDQAARYAKGLDVHGHRDWRVPTKAELNVLFQNRATIGGLNTTGSVPAGWYWSSSQINKYNAWAQRFSFGSQHYCTKDDASSLRCVRRSMI
jgi:Protein of unknown function (DUF1566)